MSSDTDPTTMTEADRKKELQELAQRMHVAGVSRHFVPGKVRNTQRHRVASLSLRSFIAKHGTLGQPEPTRKLHASDLPGRNEPCPCGSGRKFKKCCLPTL